MKALNNKVQKKALVAKRSAPCMVMQNKFAGKYSAKPDSLRKVKILTKRVPSKELCELCCVENKCVWFQWKVRRDDWKTQRPIVFSEYISTRPPSSEKCAVGIVSRKKIGRLATTQLRYLHCWYLSTTTRRGSTREIKCVKLIF
jgi:hypothetical protein